MKIVRSLVCGERGSWEWSEEVALGEGEEGEVDQKALVVGRFMTVKLESAQALSCQTSCCHVHRGCKTFGIVCNGAGSA